MSADFSLKSWGPYPLEVTPGIPLTFGVQLTANQDWPYPGDLVTLSIGQLPSGFSIRILDPTHFLAPNSTDVASVEISCPVDHPPGLWFFVIAAQGQGLSRRLILQVKVPG